MDFDTSLSFKRKSSSVSQIKSSKRKRIVESHINILDLSDCTLLHVLKFLDVTSLYLLGETCTRFKQLVEDESLWVYADARSQPNSDGKIQFCWQNVNKRTKALLMAGPHRSDFVLSLSALFRETKLTNLTILALEHQSIKYCSLKEFPRTLEELSLRHSFVPRHSDFFRFAQEGMVNLKTLILDHCQWLEADSLISFSRLPQLEILSLYMCKKLGDDDISDVSLAGKFGFKTLKVIDLRFTGLGENFLKTFYKSTSLQCIYFQCFPSTYQLERIQRKIDILNGESRIEHSYLSDDETNNDVSRRSFKKRFNAEKLISSDSQTINDETMLVFDCLKPNEDRKERPKSHLYIYPYDDCTCGFFDKKSATFGPVEVSKQNEEIDQPENTLLEYTLKNHAYLMDSPSSTDDENDDWNVNNLQKRLHYELNKQRQELNKKKDVFFMQPNTPRICRRITFDCCTSPSWCQVQSHSNDCHHRWLYAREPRNDFEISMLEHTDKHYKIRAIHSCGKRNADCECGNVCGNAETISVIVVARNEEGRIVHYRPPWSRPSDTVEVKLKESTNAEITHLISKLTGYFTHFEQLCIGDVLKAFNECSGLADYPITINISKLLDDKEFIQGLYENLSALAKLLNENCERVLSYHYGCFGDLLGQLRQDKRIESQKQILILFFKNLLCSVNGEEFLDQAAVKQQQKQAQPTEENWNRPGPSGLQPTATSNKSEGAEGNDNKSKENNGENKREDFSKNTNTKSEGQKKVTLNRDFFTDGNFIETMPIRKARISDPDVIPLRHNLNIFVERGPSRKAVVLRLPHLEGNRERRHDNIILQAISRDIPTNIKELSLRGYRVTDKTLLLLKEMDLDLLDVTNTQVTANGVQRFMMSNPQCRLIHESACVCRPRLHF